MATFSCPRCKATYDIPGYDGSPSCGECLNTDSRIVKMTRVEAPRVQDLKVVPLPPVEKTQVRGSRASS